MKTKSTSPDRDQQVRDFLATGLNDYIAARVLFLAALPQQAAILSSTAIEKYFKAILAFRGNESRGHLNKAHWNGVKNFSPTIFQSLNEGFLELNRLAYLLRYTEDLAPGFNLVIATREFLAELDHTILSVQAVFAIDSEGRKQKDAFSVMREQNDERLLRDNHVLLSTEKAVFIYSQPQVVYEARMLAPNRLLEATYVSDARPDDPSFRRAGWFINDLDRSIFKFSHRPVGGIETNQPSA